MKRTVQTAARFSLLACALAGLAGTASAYYHFLHYASRNGPFVPIPEKFDLSTQFNRTVYFYVSDVGPINLAQSDSYAGVLSELRLAGQTWNNVATSDLRVAYGGMFSPDTPQSRPRMEVTFDEMPAGLIALGGVTSRAGVTAGPDGQQFVPIVRSVVILNRDLTQLPSYSSAFFLTAVHEMGHALGLQHTMTSSVMSTDVTRAATKAKPLGADDVAGISLLYPNAKFASDFGSISGQVTMSGGGVHLASVVVVSPTREAVSALANPDGTYRIDGIAPGQYQVYVHALPPSVQSDLGPSEIVLPLDPDGNPIPASEPFQTQFYPGTQDLQQALPVQVAAGNTTEGINFSVQPHAAPQLYGVSTWSLAGASWVKPAYVNTGSPSRAFLAAIGTGLVANSAPTPGLNVTVLGGSPGIAPNGVHSYLDPNWLEVDFFFSLFPGLGPRHLVFSAGDELYVLPSGLTLVNQPPPFITSITPDSGGSGGVDIDGVGLKPDTRILFDGLPATVNSFDPAGGRLVVTPPQGASGYTANVVALNNDGQSSSFLQFPPPTHTYGPSDPPSITLATNSLPAGAEGMLEVSGVNTNFADGQTSVGLGSSDILVKRVWIVSPTLLRADIVIAPLAPATSTQVSVVTGFQVINQPFAFQIQPADAGAVVLSSDLVNAATGQPGVYPGITAAVSVTNLDPAASAILTLNDVAVQIVSISQNQITFQVPAGFKPGLAVLRLQTGAGQANPVVVQIDPAPPVVLGVSTVSAPADSDHPALPGDLLVITVSGLADPGPTVDASRLRVTVGGIDQQLLGPATAIPDLPGQYQVQIILSQQVVPGQLVPLTVSIDNRTSSPYPIAVRGL